MHTNYRLVAGSSPTGGYFSCHSFFFPPQQILGKKYHFNCQTIITFFHTFPHVNIKLTSSKQYFPHFLVKHHSILFVTRITSLKKYRHKKYTPVSFFLFNFTKIFTLMFTIIRTSSFVLALLTELQISISFIKIRTN